MFGGAAICKLHLAMQVFPYLSTALLVVDTAGAAHPSLLTATAILQNSTIQNPGWDPSKSDCCKGCEDIARPLAGLGLPWGPWIQWTCKDWASIYGMDVIGNCDVSRIQASPNCDQRCQQNPGFIKTRCPQTCGVPICEGGEMFPVLGFCTGFLFFLVCCCGCKVCHIAPQEKRGPLLGIAILSGSALVVVFWAYLDPAAKTHGKKDATEQAGGIGDFAGLVVGFLLFFLLPELCKGFFSCCRNSVAGFHGCCQRCCFRCCCSLRHRSLPERAAIRRQQGFPVPDLPQPSAPPYESESQTLPHAQESRAANCVVCMERPKEILIRPCKHVCFCAVCSKVQVWQHCPVCRGPAAALEVVYV